MKSYQEYEESRRSGESEIRKKAKTWEKSGSLYLPPGTNSPESEKKSSQQPQPQQVQEKPQQSQIKLPPEVEAHLDKFVDAEIERLRHVIARAIPMRKPPKGWIQSARDWWNNAKERGQAIRSGEALPSGDDAALIGSRDQFKHITSQPLAAWNTNDSDLVMKFYEVFVEEFNNLCDVVLEGPEALNSKGKPIPGTFDAYRIPAGYKPPKEHGLWHFNNPQAANSYYGYNFDPNDPNLQGIRTANPVQYLGVYLNNFRDELKDGLKKVLSNPEILQQIQRKDYTQTPKGLYQYQTPDGASRFDVLNTGAPPDSHFSKDAAGNFTDKAVNAAQTSVVTSDNISDPGSSKEIKINDPDDFTSQISVDTSTAVPNLNSKSKSEPRATSATTAKDAGTSDVDSYIKPDVTFDDANFDDTELKSITDEELNLAGTEKLKNWFPHVDWDRLEQEEIISPSTMGMLGDQLKEKEAEESWSDKLKSVIESMIKWKKDVDVISQYSTGEMNLDQQNNSYNPSLKNKVQDVLIRLNSDRPQHSLNGMSINERIKYYKNMLSSH